MNTITDNLQKLNEPFHQQYLPSKNVYESYDSHYIKRKFMKTAGKNLQRQTNLKGRGSILMTEMQRNDIDLCAKEVEYKSAGIDTAGKVKQQIKRSMIFG